jgi:hypothetical protein
VVDKVSEVRAIRQIQDEKLASATTALREIIENSENRLMAVTRKVEEKLRQLTNMSELSKPDSDKPNIANLMERIVNLENNMQLRTIRTDGRASMADQTLELEQQIEALTLRCSEIEQNLV